MSPTLFNIFLDDIDEEWKRRKEGGVTIGNRKIFGLKFADDSDGSRKCGRNEGNVKSVREIYGKKLFRS